MTKVFPAPQRTARDAEISLQAAPLYPRRFLQEVPQGAGVQKEKRGSRGVISVRCLSVKKTISSLVKEFLSSDIEKQRYILTLFLLTESDTDTQYLAHLMYDMISNEQYLWINSL